MSGVLYCLCVVLLADTLTYRVRRLSTAHTLTGFIIFTRFSYLRVMVNTAGTCLGECYVRHPQDETSSLSRQ
jgi:hypothetical protein